MKAWKSSCLIILGLVLGKQSQAAVNFWGGYTGARPAQQDITKPVQAGRSYFVTSVEEIPGGAKLIVELYHGELNAPVALQLQIALNDGKGKVVPISFKELSAAVADNPTNYYSRREFTLSYANLNAALEPLLPATAKGLKIEPGTPLFVFAEWPKFKHQWGGIDRGGIFFMPEDSAKAAQEAQSLPPERRPDALDLAYPITSTMAMKYSNLQDPKLPGLKPGGQIRSRLESEGKYQVQIANDDVARIKKQLFEIAKDPAKASSIMGPDWIIEAEMRYMKKDAQNNFILDGEGLPTPDPMVDTYYDNENYDAAKNDIALRYRWTEGNATGAWNFKPGAGQVSKDGIIDRLEYGVDTTDDKPETVRPFADSLDPLNPFRIIRDIIPGAVPSEFLKPSIKITDTRFKFKLKHKNGLVVELSLDNVSAESLRIPNGSSSKFAQLEMDIDHLSTASQNIATAPNSTPSAAMTPEISKFLASLGSNAFVDGRSGLHTFSDLDASSPLKQKHKEDFELASTAIKALREQLIGSNWVFGAQKNAFASYDLGLVSKEKASVSVKRALGQERVSGLGAAICGSVFVTP